MPSRRPPHPRSFQHWAPPAREHRAAGPLGNPWAQLGPTERWPFPRVSHSGGRFRSYNGNSRPGSRASQKGRMHETRVCQGGRGGRGGLAHWHRGSSACCAPAARRPHCPTRLKRTVGPGPARESARLGVAGGGGSRALLQDAVSTSKARPLSLSSTSTTLPSLSEVPRSVRRRGPRDLTRAGSCGPHQGLHL